jgi:hypothetical protein
MGVKHSCVLQETSAAGQSQAEQARGCQGPLAACTAEGASPLSQDDKQSHHRASESDKMTKRR